MNYQVFGPLDVTRNGTLVSRRPEDKRRFWDAVEEQATGLSHACGCYVFVIRGRAWYVGLAERQSFKQEWFALHKLTQYNEALQRVRGRPSLILIAKLTPSGRFAKPTSRGRVDIQILENLLIGSALSRNHELQNVKGTKLLREMNVPGILNSRQGQARASSVQCLKRALGV